MTTASELTMDLHVHSTFSDGKGTLGENLAAAEAAGLGWLGMVDHVRADTDWIADFSWSVEAMRDTTSIQLLCGVEAKLLDTEGRLDLPDRLPGVDYVVVADHQVPTAEGAAHPAAVRAALENGSLAAGTVVEDLVAATIGALERCGPAVVAHLFSVLPKIGLSELEVPASLVAELGWAIARANAVVEVNERWTSPSPRVAELLAEQSVCFVASTDSHRPATIGRYSDAAKVIRALELPVATPEQLRRGVAPLVG